ncbi:MAG TPA: tripartite tricarboxylate transporter substrate binding protein [Burkholderiales bacterium]|nr:tripartite tricarboxylate transporter substrate binding protein [Burkholderiales bacterium]
MRTLIFLLMASAAGAGLAQGAFPEKPLRLVVGFSAGGPTDLPARFVAEKLGNALGQRVVVENHVGAAGQIATQDVLSKPRDGYNLLLCTHFDAINLAVYKQVAYKLADLAPVSQISRYYYGVVAANSLPADGWEGFLAYARAHPGELNYGTIGRGSAQEILALELAKLTGIKLTGVPYKGGAEVMNDLIPGRVHLYVSPTLAVLPLYKAGKVRILAVSSPERLAAAPDVPTLTEKGLPFVRFGWLGVCAGAGTPQAVIALLNRHIAAIVKAPDYREMIEKAGSVPLSSTPEQLGAILADTYEQTAAIAREFGLQVQ